MASISVEELQRIFGSFLDDEVIRSIHEDARGNRFEAVAQLEMLTGVVIGEDSAVDSHLPLYAGAGVPSDMSRSCSDLVCVEGMGSPLPTGSSDAGAPLVDYDNAVATGEDKVMSERQHQLRERYKDAIEDIAALVSKDRAFDAEIARQTELGAQSLRKNSISLTKFSNLPHHVQCFEAMLRNEKALAGEFVVFYHSYSFAALIYEVQCCIARVAYGLVEDFAPLPRLLKGPFVDKPHLKVLLNKFTSLQGQDHDPNFRAVAISCSLSLDAPHSEAPPLQVFDGGYSCNDLSFEGVLQNIFKTLNCSPPEVCELTRRVVEVAEQYNLHAAQYSSSLGRSSCATARSHVHAGHMLQLFIRRDVVDDVAYGSHAYGVFEASHNPLSRYLAQPSAPRGQARVFWHPALFTDTKKSRVFHFCADEEFARRRPAFQQALQGALKPLFCPPPRALRTFHALEGAAPRK